MLRRARTFDVFCRVVDNFGDAGVSLRLARLLAAEHDGDVTLWIDDAAALSQLLGVAGIGEDPHDGVRIRRLAAMRDDVACADVVIDAFGGGLPERYLDAMERAAQAPVWIVLEYLSAESWIDGANALPSPHPMRALRRWFVFPGFSSASAGLLRERGLLDARRRFVRSAHARSEPWTSLGFAAPAADALVVSLFCYANPALAALLATWRDDGQPIACLVPEGVARSELESIARRSLRSGDSVRSGALTGAVAPFVRQDEFDRRLWGSDLCVVRGEDSFVRAQWAAKPFVWHAYPQEQRAHVAKLDAFLDRYTTGLDARTALAYRAFSEAFNEGNGDAVAAAWPALRDSLPVLRAHGETWADALAGHADLASWLVDFADRRL